jgi:predicted dehydrogenase
MNRRLWLGSAFGALAAVGGQARNRYRAAIIGHTGAGDYGHEWITTWSAFDFIDVVAVADVDERGRRKAAELSHAARSYADYREMLKKEKPDLVSICPRLADLRVQMVTAAAQTGTHMLVEKPLARNLLEADAIVRTVAEHRVKLQCGLVMRTVPSVVRAKEMLETGRIGVLQEIRARGKEDSRAGGEEMTVLGPHLFDLIRMFAGDPRWVFAHVSEDGREMDRRHLRPPKEPVGSVAGNQIAAMFAFDHGVSGYFSSKINDGPNGARFGLYLYGSKGAIFIPITRYPNGDPLLLPAPSWLTDDRVAWRPIEAPAGGAVRTRHQANVCMAADLIAAIEQNREPACGAAQARWTVEMLQGVYLSQESGARVTFPLRERRNPLEL